MFNPVRAVRRWLTKRDALRKIGAYQEVPKILREMEGLLEKEGVMAHLTVERLPPEELKKRLIAVSREFLPRQFPGLAEAIEAEIPEEDKDEAYVQATSRVAAMMIPVVDALRKDALAKIEKDCADGIDRELDVLRGLRKEGRKRGGVKGEIPSDPQ